jgi:hypothetical protein
MAESTHNPSGEEYTVEGSCEKATTKIYQNKTKNMPLGVYSIFS